VISPEGTHVVGGISARGATGAAAVAEAIGVTGRGVDRGATLYARQVEVGARP